MYVQKIDESLSREQSLQSKFCIINDVFERERERDRVNGKTHIDSYRNKAGVIDDVIEKY